jgi:hypothetical protein
MCQKHHIITLTLAHRAHLPSTKPPRCDPHNLAEKLDRPFFFPGVDESWGRVKPLVAAIRTASRRNSSVYLFAILNLLHSKHCSKETGTKPRQDQVNDISVKFPVGETTYMLDLHIQ